MAQSTFRRAAGQTLVLAGVISVPIGIFNLFYPPAIADTLWGHPFTHPTHVAVSVVLVVAHLLKVPGFVALSRLDGGGPVTAWSMRIAALGFVVVAICEAVSAYLYGVPITSQAAIDLNNGYGVGSMLGAVPSMVGGTIIGRRQLLAGPGRWSVLLSGAFMIFVVTPALIMGRGPAAYLTLAGWSLFFIWIGTTLVRSEDAQGA